MRTLLLAGCEQCLETTAKCNAAAERCVEVCGTFGDFERERCAMLGRDCADVGRLVEGLMQRSSPFMAEACALHASTCDALADFCEKWPDDACCHEAMVAARACARACRVCATGKVA